MATRNNNNIRGDRDITSGRGEQRSSAPNDLPDKAQDKEEMEPEETTVDLPDVSDIPGQRNVSAPPLGELADTTISSDDEEGEGLFDDDVDYIMGTEGDVGRDERRALQDDEYLPTRDEDNLRSARLNDEDFEGDPLNE